MFDTTGLPLTLFDLNPSLFDNAPRTTAIPEAVLAGQAGLGGSQRARRHLPARAAEGSPCSSAATTSHLPFWLDVLASYNACIPSALGSFLCVLLS